MKELARVSYPSVEEGIRRIATIINKLVNESPFHDNTTVTADHIADGRYRRILADCTAGPITVTIPSAVDIEGSFSIKKTDPSSNAVTVDAAGSSNIDGSATAVWATQYDSFIFVSDGTHWYIA